jgi:hypothetical protein
MYTPPTELCCLPPSDRRSCCNRQSRRTRNKDKRRKHRIMMQGTQSGHPGRNKRKLHCKTRAEKRKPNKVTSQPPNALARSGTHSSITRVLDRLELSSSREGWRKTYMRRDSGATNRPRARWDFHCHNPPAPDHPLSPSYMHHSARHTCGATTSRDQEKLHEYLRDHCCPGQSFRPISF